MLRIHIWMLLVVWVSGCARTDVTRLDPQSVTDLSGKWNDTDSRLVAEEMIADALNHPWLATFTTENARQPVIIVGNIRNRSHEHIAIDTFINEIERALINSGLVEMVQSGAMRDDIRQERADQQEFASEETRARWKQETGADFMLSGTIQSIVDQEGKQQVVFYQIDLELSDLETNRKVWIGDKKLKKLIQQGRKFKL
ncbi:MAG: penicillin-binding protein activator LpoB [Gemmatimonadetes bacterium]|nr:MAG: penicillin-binding protein activator LpoB [Gemmatimonadota bacterium]